MKNQDRGLPTPPEVLQDSKSLEVLRAWVANEGLVCAVRPTAWTEAGAWGIVLADAARHVANALQEVSGHDPSRTVAEIQEMFNQELTDPTDEPTGNFVA